MDISQELLQHSIDLLKGCNGAKPTPVELRRAISAAYYSVFHRINADAVALLAPNVPVSINHRIQRWFEHAEMKKICGRFTASKLDQPLLALIGPSASTDLQTVARNFILLQEARHSADYDLSFPVTLPEATKHVDLALLAVDAWSAIRASAEANIFILSLLMWKNWDKER